MSDNAWQSWIMDLRARLDHTAVKRLPPSDGRQAAVLVPLYVDAGELWTLLTKRTESLPTHKGQIAFPGGSLEPDESVWDAALRETEEEIGIEAGKVLKLGQLDEIESSSGFRILPCVGAVPFPLEHDINEDEIEEAFGVPLSAFINPHLVEDQAVSINGDLRIMRVYHVGNHRVWGLTARIIQLLLQRLGFEAVEPS